MKHLFFSGLLLCLMAGCTHCKKDPPTSKPGDYFIFGTAFGMCGGNCATFFKVQDGHLYADTMSYYLYSHIYGFSSTALPDSDYTRAVTLWSHMPSYLNAHPDTVFGCPDCHDQGGIYIQQKKGSTIQNWDIDTDTARQPVPIRAYVTEIADLVNRLRK